MSEQTLALHKRTRDLTGQRFGRWTVLEFAGYQEGTARWLCRCNCGTIRETRAVYLMNGGSQSCGCLTIERMRAARCLPPGIANRKRAYKGYKDNARRRDIEFDLTFEQALELFALPCYVCGTEPSNVSADYEFNGTFVYQGIDRVDNSAGYVLDNCRPCCKICNHAKNNMSLEEFNDWLERAYWYREKQ